MVFSTFLFHQKVPYAINFKALPLAKERGKPQKYKDL